METLIQLANSRGDRERGRLNINMSCIVHGNDETQRNVQRDLIPL